MFEPEGYVNYWTEFLTSVTSALAAFSLDFDDLGLARRVWNSTTPARQEGRGAFSLRNYTLTEYFDAARGLVVRTPRPLVDWPRSDAIDINESTAGVCNDACVQMNAHAVTVQQQASILAGRMGMPQEAAAYAARAAAIRAAAHAAFYEEDSDKCNPPGAGPCYRDDGAPRKFEAPLSKGPSGAGQWQRGLRHPGSKNGTATTTVQATAMATDARLGGSAEMALRLVPFLRARNLRRGAAHGLELSGWQSFFMLRGVYSAAGETGEGLFPLGLAADAAAFGWEALTGTGVNSWLGGMIGVQNATMTTESWIVSHAPLPGQGGSTMSHPWTAAPAAVLPRWLLGIRPLEPGWRTLAVRPLPHAGLEGASIEVPTPRGVVSLAFRQRVETGTGTGTGNRMAATARSWVWEANVTVPGNTFADVCAPLYNAGDEAATNCSVSGPPMVARGALVCLRENMLGGSLAIRVACTFSG